MSRKVVFILLSIFVILIVIYVLLDKRFEVDELINNDFSYEVIDSPKSDVYYIKIDYFDYCDDASCYFVDLEELKKENINDSKINLDIKCNKKDEIDDNNYCTNIDVSIDNKISLNLDTVKNYYYDESLIVFKTNKYYIVKQTNSIYGSGLLNIYNNNGKLLKEIKNNVTSYEVVINDEVNEDSEIYEVSVNDNKLYYAYTDDLDFVIGLDNLVHLGYIDLDEKMEFHELQVIKGLTSLGI